MLNNVRFLSCSKAATRGRRLTLFLLTRGLVALILYFMTCDQLPSCSMLQWCLPTSSACWCWATILTYGMRQHSTWSSPANCWQRKGYEIFFFKLSNSEFGIFFNILLTSAQNWLKILQIFSFFRIWIIPSCLVTRQLTSTNVPSGLFWRRTCFCIFHLLTMKKLVSVPEIFLAKTSFFLQ